jgi:F-type H+-transporting ATPase subunit epsilon
MAGSLTLRVITPDRILLDAQVGSVQIPGVDGWIGILPRHAHMVAALDVGPLRYVENGQSKGVFVSQGFAEVRQNTLRVVCEAGEMPAEIDPQRAKEAEKRARERLARGKGAAEPVDVLRAEASLRRALMRMRVLDLYSRERVRS